MPEQPVSYYEELTSQEAQPIPLTLGFLSSPWFFIGSLSSHFSFALSVKSCRTSQRQRMVVKTSQMWWQGYWMYFAFCPALQSGRVSSKPGSCLDSQVQAYPHPLSPYCAWQEMENSLGCLPPVPSIVNAHSMAAIQSQGGALKEHRLRDISA